MLTVNELKEKYKVKSTQTVYNWMAAGMPYRKIGRLTRFEPEAVDEWLKAKAAGSVSHGESTS